MVTTKNLELDEEIAMYHMLLVEGEAIARCVCVCDCLCDVLVTG